MRLLGAHIDAADRDPDRGRDCRALPTSGGAAVCILNHRESQPRHFMRGRPAKISS